MKIRVFKRSKPLLPATSSIRIQGLDGKYMLLRDGLPLYSGYSGGFNWMQIAPVVGFVINVGLNLSAN